MILFAFSIPFPTPNIRIITATTSAMICHRLLPKAEAIPPNDAAKESILSGASVLPVNVPIMYFRIHPMTTVYPIAIAREPSTGIKPSVSPTFRLPRDSHAAPKASIGPDRVPRPKLISPMTPVDAIKTTKIKYGIRYDPPP